MTTGHQHHIYYRIRTTNHLLNVNYYKTRRTHHLHNVHYKTRSTNHPHNVNYCKIRTTNHLHNVTTILWQHITMLSTTREPGQLSSSKSLLLPNYDDLSLKQSLVARLICTLLSLRSAIFFSHWMNFIIFK